MNLEEYVGQPMSLPQSIEADLSAQTEQLIAFGMFDLTKSFKLTQNWLVITDRFVHFYELTQLIMSICVEDVESVKIKSGANCNRFSVKVKGSTEPQLVALYTNRQSHMATSLKYVLEEKLKSKETYQFDAEKFYKDSLLKPLSHSSVIKPQSEKDVIWRLLMLLKPYKKSVAIGLVSAVLFTLFALVPAYLTGYLVDSVIKPFQSGKLSREGAFQLFYMAIAGLVATKLLMEFFAWIRLKTMSILGERVAKDLRDRVYTHLHKLSLSYFSSKSTGSLISRVSSDTDRIWDFVAFGVVQVITSVIKLMGLSAVLIYMDLKLGLMVSLPVPILLWMIAKHGDRMRSIFLKCWRRWSEITDCISDTIPGIRVVKAFNKGEHEVDRFKGRNEQAYDEFVKAHNEWTSFWPMLMMIIHCIVISVWFFGIPRVFEHVEAFKVIGDQAMVVGLTPGKFVAFVIYMTMFVQPIEIIGQMARMVNRATSSAYRVFEVLDAEPQVVDAESPVILNDLRGDIEFNNVSFSYDGIRKVLNNINFKVNAGEMIGLVGPSGSGKTTITNLLARFYDIKTGSIKVDGVNLEDLNLGHYREQVGMVLQEPYLFHGSIYNNIKYGCPEAGLDKIIEASKAANAHEFIMKLSSGYDSIVGERGHTLSGGERQRISIARAILRNPKILILDEATSAVDTETENKIQQALDRLVKGRTVFVIAHRLSTLAKANRILVIKNGSLVESGSHESLLEIEGGVYQGLVNIQANLSRVRV